MARRCPLFCYITDRSQFSGSEITRLSALTQKIAEAARAGVDYIQLREKDLTGRELESLAKSAVQIIREQQTPNCQPSATRLLLNSRADSALAANADGVHLRSNDITVADVRSIWEAATGRMLQCPPILGSRIAAKSEALSNCGQQSQSIEPKREMSAAERPLPMTA